MNVTAAMVKELREATGAGMLDCKKALVECDGDMDKAVDFLREKGLAGAAKKAGRIAAEGIVKNAVSADGKKAVTVEVNEESFFEDMKHSKWKIALGYQMTPSLLVSAGLTDAAKETAAAIADTASDDAIKAAFKAIIGANEVLYSKTRCGVEVWDNTNKKLVRNKLWAFNKDTYLVRPSGKVGIKKNVVPLRPDPSAISTTIFGGHGIIEYRYDARTKYQDWVSELTVLCVPTRPRDMFILHTK